MELRSIIHDGLAVVHLEQGELESAAVNLEKARQGWLKLGNDGALAANLNNLAVLYYWRGDFDIALDEVREAQRAATSASYQRLVAAARITQGIVQRAQRNHEEALASFLAGLEEARRILDLRLVAEATNGLGNTYRGLGHADKAETLLKQAVIEAEQSGQKYFAARYCVSLGKVYCELGAFPDALQSLSLAERLFGEQGSLRGQAEAKLHQGVSLYRMGRTLDALQSMKQLADVLERLGYEGFLVPDGDEAPELLRLSAAKGVGGERFRSLLRRIEGWTEDRDAGGPRHGRRPLPPVKAFGFGRAQVFLEQHEIADQEWRSRKAKELFFFLLCAKGRASKENLVEALWPDAGLGDHEDALRMNVHRLRQAVYPECVLSAGDGYRINPDSPVEFDLKQFEEALHEAERHERGSDVRIRRLLQAVALYRGPFLDEFYSEWCQSLRRTLDLKYCRALMSLAGHFAARGEFSRAVEMVEKAVAYDPYDETAQMMLAKAYVQLGDPLSALRRMRDYMRLAREELQVEPSRAFLDLYSQALKQAPFAASASR